MKSLTWGLEAKLPSGSTLLGALSECGQATCYTFTAPNGEVTRLALSPSAVHTLVEMYERLREEGQWRECRLQMARAAHEIRPNVPLSWLFLLEWASGEQILQRDASH
jgi:hypothetical protein